MKNKKNEEYVLAQGDWTSIRLSLRAPADDDAQLRFGALGAFDTVQECFSPVLTVTGVEMTLKRRDPAVPLAQFKKSVSKIPDVENPITIRHSEGIDGERLKQRLGDLDIRNEDLFVSPIKCTDTITHVFLSEGMCRIATGDAGADRRYKSDTPRDKELGEPSGPATFFDITYVPEGHLPNRDTAEFVCEFRTVIDIWFGESLLSQINRVRLHECFNLLDTHLPIIDTSVINVMAGVTENDVVEVLEYDGPSSEALIDRYWEQN